MTHIDQIVGGIYRISTMPKDSPVGFNQFLIDDEQPALIHTGMAPMYADVCKAIGRVLDPSRLAYIILLHFEGDECGGMDVHHWDSMMLWEEKTSSLFPADLFIQPGDQPPVIHENISSAMCELYRHAGIFAHEDPVRRVVDRVERMKPEWVHAMHGGTLTGKIFPSFTRALRDQPFAYRGELLGRTLATEQAFA